MAVSWQRVQRAYWMGTCAFVHGTLGLHVRTHGMWHTCLPRHPLVGYSSDAGACVCRALAAHLNASQLLQQGDVLTQQRAAHTEHCGQHRQQGGKQVLQ